MENTIKWFIETFKDDETVGLVLKTNLLADSIFDREHTTARLQALIAPHKDRKCKIYLIHGELVPGQLEWLYQHPTMKALINIAHGEGYGLPMFEAAYNGLPLITTTWSGQMDFICKPNKKGKRVPRVIRVDYDIKPVQKQAVWKGVIEENSMWAYAKENSYKRALQDCLEKEAHYQKEAKTLQRYILQNFKEENLYEQFVALVNLQSTTDDEIDDLFSQLQFE
jgi:glycosyltransferase involved in cell wall biosynthesis